MRTKAKADFAITKVNELREELHNIVYAEDWSEGKYLRVSRMHRLEKKIFDDYVHFDNESKALHTIIKELDQRIWLLEEKVGEEAEVEEEDPAYEDEVKWSILGE